MMVESNAPMEATDEKDPEKSPVVLVKRSYAGCLLALFVGMALLLVTGFASFYFFVTKPTVDTGEQWADRVVR